MHNMFKAGTKRCLRESSEGFSWLTLYGKNGNCTRRYSSKTRGIVIATDREMQPLYSIVFQEKAMYGLTLVSTSQEELLCLPSALRP